MGHAWEHIDYYDNASILNVYYAEVEALVQASSSSSSSIELGLG